MDLSKSKSLFEGNVEQSEITWLGKLILSGITHSFAEHTT